MAFVYYFRSRIAEVTKVSALEPSLFLCLLLSLDRHKGKLFFMKLKVTWPPPSAGGLCIANIHPHFQWASRNSNWQQTVSSLRCSWELGLCCAEPLNGASCARHCSERPFNIRRWLMVREAPSVLDKQEHWRQNSQILGPLWYSLEDVQAEADDFEHCSNYSGSIC